MHHEREREREREREWRLLLEVNGESVRGFHACSSRGCPLHHLAPCTTHHAEPCLATVATTSAREGRARVLARGCCVGEGAEREAPALGGASHPYDAAAVRTGRSREPPDHSPAPPRAPARVFSPAPGVWRQLEQAASDLVSSLRIQRPVPEGEEDLQERHDVQVLLHSTEDPMTLRKLSVRAPRSRASAAPH
jgi:hypothetical protein